MEWNIENFLGLNAVFVILMLLYFWGARDGSLKPSRLKFSKSNDGATNKNKSSQRNTITKDLSIDSDQTNGERVLNVIFNYNGHSWDAYEVLGIPAGMDVDGARQAYERIISQCDKSSQSFYETAFLAIKQSSQASKSKSI